MLLSRLVLDTFVISRSLIIIMSLISTLAERKEKRMIWGKELRDRDSYDVIGYYAYIAEGFRCSSVFRAIKQLFNMYDVCPPLPSHLICGGAMIMPNIVQTACHCVAQTIPVNDTYAIMKPKNHWESMLTIFHGYTLVSDMTDDGVWSSKLWIHQKCENVGYGISHDFALILLNQPVLMRRPFLRMAPVYTKKELAAWYRRTVRKESVCLHLGFGGYNWVRPGIQGPLSPIMMHGWRLTRGYWWCYWELRNAVRKANYDDYADKATWCCETFFGKERAFVAQGDSGSPIVCSSQYFGITSFIVKFKNRNVSLSAHGALAFAVFENAVEYRKSLVTTLMENTYQEQYLAPTFRPNLTRFYQERTDQLNATQKPKEEDKTTQKPGAEHRQIEELYSISHTIASQYTTLFSIIILLFGVTY